MHLNIELPDELGAAVQAQAHGVSADRAEEIDENRREMFHNFVQDF